MTGLIETSGLSLGVGQAIVPALSSGGGLEFLYAADGSADAPAGVSPQHPTLLNGYAARPSWKVAGVDYGVGPPASTVFQDWQSISMPGVTVTPGQAIGVRGDNVNNLVFDSIDFSLHTGTILYLNNCQNTIVRNCKFGGSTLPTIGGYVIQLTGGSQNLILLNSVLDFGGAGTGSAFVGAGPAVTLWYNWFKNFPQRVLETGGTCQIDCRYNVIEQGGMQLGAHMNYLQFGGGGTYSAIWQYNTTYQTPQVAGGEGPQFYSGITPGTLASADFSFNTMIASGANAMSYMSHGSGDASGNTPGGSTTALGGGRLRVYSNYFDASGAFGAGYPGSWVDWDWASNIDMTTGNVIPLP